MLRFEGDKTFRQTPEIVWARLVDPAFLISCVPDLEHVIRSEGDEVAFALRPGLAFVRGHLEVNGTFARQGGADHGELRNSQQGHRFEQLRCGRSHAGRGGDGHAGPLESPR